MKAEQIIRAYSQGFFPWPNGDEPVRWYNPDPRFVLLFKDFHISQSLQKNLQKNGYEVKLDTCFDQVIQACSETPRPNQPGTWIRQDIISAYTELHQLGLAHSVETFAVGQSQLVGGLYGVSLGGVFFGESMFSHQPNASKIAFVKLVEQLVKWDFDFIDCQAYTEHLARFGAAFWPRETFLRELQKSLKRQTRQGLWRFSNDF